MLVGHYNSLQANSKLKYTNQILFNYAENIENFVLYDSSIATPLHTLHIILNHILKNCTW